MTPCSARAASRDPNSSDSVWAKDSAPSAEASSAASPRSAPRLLCSTRSGASTPGGNDPPPLPPLPLAAAVAAVGAAATPSRPIDLEKSATPRTAGWLLVSASEAVGAAALLLPAVPPPVDAARECEMLMLSGRHSGSGIALGQPTERSERFLFFSPRAASVDGAARSSSVRTQPMHTRLTGRVEEMEGEESPLSVTAGVAVRRAGVHSETSAAKERGGTLAVRSGCCWPLQCGRPVACRSSRPLLE